MTNIQEARLSREAGICYSTIAMITDYDCWYVSPEVESVSVEMILENLSRNAETAKQMILNTLRELPDSPSCECAEALRDSIITSREAVPEETLEKLKPIIEGFI